MQLNNDYKDGILISNYMKGSEEINTKIRKRKVKEKRFDTELASLLFNFLISYNSKIRFCEHMPWDFHSKIYIMKIEQNKGKR